MRAFTAYRCRSNVFALSSPAVRYTVSGVAQRSSALAPFGSFRADSVVTVRSCRPVSVSTVTTE